MKKLLFTLCAILLSVGAYAQKGQSAIGLNLNVAPALSHEDVSANFGFGAKYQYGLSNPLRIEGGFNYYLKSSDIGMFDFSVNLHYLFKVSERINVYPLAGIGYIKVTGDDEEVGVLADQITPNNVVFNLGAGAEYSLSQKLKLNIEVKYPISVDINPLPISIGIAYKL